MYIYKQLMKYLYPLIISYLHWFTEFMTCQFIKCQTSFHLLPGLAPLLWGTWQKKYVCFLPSAKLLSELLGQ